MDTAATREDLLYAFRRIAEKNLPRIKQLDSVEAINRIIPMLVDEVPNTAFEPASAIDDGFVFLNGNINDKKLRNCQEALMRVHLNLPKRVPIKLHLNSTGGWIISAFGIMSVIQNIQRDGRKVNIHVAGEASSIASVILQAGSWRTMEPTGYMILHEINYEVEHTKLSDHEDELAIARVHYDIAIDFYVRRTGKPASYWKRRMKRTEWHLTADQALEEGLVDEVLPFPDYSEVKKRRA